jgi:hypothetical protein
MTYSLGFATYTYVSAALYALMEIEIEGRYGWCKKLPTFTIQSGPFKNFTFYHLIMTAIVFLTNMYPLCLLQFGGNSLSSPSYVTSLMVNIFNLTLWFGVEDFLWFVLNPYYTLKRYKRDQIPWHSWEPWPFGIAAHNYFSFALMLFCYQQTHDIIMIYSLIASAFYTCIVIQAAPLYHRFYLLQERHDALQSETAQYRTTQSETAQSETAQSETAQSETAYRNTASYLTQYD